MLNLLTPAIDVFLPIAKWLTIGIVAAAIIASLIVFFAKRNIFSKFVKYAVFFTFIFLLVLGISCLVMDIIDGYAGADAAVKYILIPIAVILTLLLIGAITTALIYKKCGASAGKISLSVSGGICLVALIITGVLLAIYYEQVKGDYEANSLVLYIASALLIISIVAVAFIFDSNKKQFDSRCIAMAGICIAMSFGLSYVKLWEMPQGGSITLASLLPIMIFSYAYGTKIGIMICFIYGILQAIQDPWLIHPAQFLLDYPVAFAAIGLTGIFANIKVFEKLPQISLLLGGLLSSSLRFLSHILSGVFAFSIYAGDVNPWIYSMGYNSFVFVDIAIVLVIGAILFSSKSFRNELFKTISK